jgi:tetratricopeptide (TPR) repeat protein
MLSLRLADARGAPDSALEASNDVAHAAAAASNAVASKAKADRPAADRVVVEAAGKQGRVLKAPEPPARQAAAGALEGPMQAFGRLAADKTAPPDLLESFARYLLLTAGDDPSENRARELARRAAERGPTTERLLLAGKLSEDRNQQREWVEKAARLAAGRDDVEVLLAQAHLARTGANWRDAVPFYDRVLAIDPDHTEALLGRVNLYEEAGLKRTALAALEAAVARNPRSVALLGAHAAALSGLGRQTEADEVSNRYAAYRFDDPTVLGSRLALAVARRDKPLALHWIARLLGADPDSASGLDAAAHAYRALGMPEQALGCYRKALELAPEDTAAMAAMAEMLGELGRRAEQLQLLRRILVLRPQTKEVREYVEHIEPPRPRSDEAFAWEPDKFLALRSAPAGGYNRRTLRDLQVTTVFPSGLSSRFRQVVFQPLTDEAAAAARQYAFVYQADREVVQLRAGRVYRADGRVDEALESAEGPADDPSIAMYTSSRTFYVQLPRIGPGDVVELRYRVEDVTPRNELADYFGEVRYMQSSEPVLGAEYVVVAPRSRALHFSAAGLTGLVREDKDAGDQHVTRFVVSSVPPVSPEPDMPAWAEILGHVHVSTYRSWDDVAKWYWGLSRDQLVPDDEVRALVDRVTKGLGTERDKVRAVYDYVVQKTRYVALEFGIFGFKPRRASQTFARGWGDCKDKAALIVTMLRVAGIPAHMVMVRSALRGDFPTDPASLAPFDHAIAYVPSLDLFLDGTAEYSGSGELPALDRGSLALVVTESGGKIVHLPDPPAQDSQRVHKLDATLAPNGSAALELRFEATGAFASEWRQRYHGESTRRERIGRDVAAELPGFELAQGPGALETADLDDIELPVRVRARGRAPGFARKEGNDLSVPVTPKDRFVPRLASLSQRRLDVRLKFQSVLDETWTVRIPAGLVVKSLPAPKSAQTPFGTLDLTVDHKEGVVGVRSRVTFSRIRVPSRDYPAFQAFCEQIDRALGQRLVLGRSR